ncbi:MAG TPA: hypothetical protein VF346_11775 [Bacteroidales bacterium]
MIINKAIIRYTFILIVVLCGTGTIRAQTYKYFPDKPGKFIIENNLSNCPGVDILSLKKNLTLIVEWFHQNEVLLNPPKGFDANISLSGNLYSSDAHPLGKGYGIMCSLNLSFRYFYAEKNVFHTASGWSAHDFDININQPLYNILGTRFGDRDFESGDEPRFEKSLHLAYEQLQKYYSVFPLEKVISPGVKLFKGSHLVISDPNQPEICLPVTVKEIMDALIGYYKVRKEMDEIKSSKLIKEMAAKGMKLNIDSNQPSVYDFILKEYSAFTPDELNRQAWVSSGEGISGINCKGLGNRVIRFNPECWNLKLPETAVQFISMDYKPGSKADLEEFSRDNNQLTDYESLFMNALPLERMGEMILKKIGN